MKPIIIVVNMNNLIDLLTIISIICLIIASISYFSINIKQRKKLSKLDLIIRKCEKSLGN